MMSAFEMTSPSSLGIDEANIEQFLAHVDRQGLELHRLLILRHGKCCAKITWAPYGEDDLHPLYSFSKSITATAIGFARQEGLLRLDEKLVDIFPDELPLQPSPNLKACTIHHLLCMSCGHETESMDFGPEWRKSFLAHPFLHVPGTFYKYNTQGTNMLACIIRKKTGMQVTEYLRKRLFDPLGIGEVFCAELPDDLHTQMGGAGMKMRLMDMAKFTQFMLNDGVWDGKVLLKGWYSMAGKKQIETLGDSEGHVKEWAFGYGYQCWMCGLPGSYRADGAFGQFGLVYPSLDLCVIMNAATEQTQSIMDGISFCLLPGVSPVNPGDERTVSADGKALLRQLCLPIPRSCRNPAFEEVLNHTVARATDRSAMSGIRRLVGGAGIFDVNPSPLPFVREPAISYITFRFGEDVLFLTLTEDENVTELAAGLTGQYVFTIANGIRYAAWARWRSRRRLEMEIRRTDAMSGVRLILDFADDTMRIETDDTLMTEGGLGMIKRPVTEFTLERSIRHESGTLKTGNNPGLS